RRRAPDRRANASAPARSRRRADARGYRRSRESASGTEGQRVLVRAASAPPSCMRTLPLLTPYYVTWCRWKPTRSGRTCDMAVIGVLLRIDIGAFSGYNRGVD